jgi:hypoxanthine-DNA glycosylase
MIIHPIPPVFDESSEVLILGSFPSVKSRQAAFFYGHPQNRFWKVLAAVFGEEAPQTVPQKKEFLLRHRVALWDVIGSCKIEGSSDASIRDVTVNDLNVILAKADIRQIYVNGKTAYRYYRKYTEPLTGRAAVCLPSTSPANASWSLDKLTQAWDIIRLSLEHH